MKTQSSNTTRSFAWEEEAPEEIIPRRAKKGVPLSGRALPSIMLESEEPEDDELLLRGKLRLGKNRIDEPMKPRWRRVRAAGRALLALAVLGGLAACAFLLFTFLSRDARFRIAGTDNIEATGLTEVSRAEMLAVFGEDIGRNIFFVPLAERRRQLEEIPWVEKATVMRLLPDQIRVSIVERQPVAFVLQPDGRTGLVDASGVLLTMPAAMMAQNHYSFPVVTGINASDPLATRTARMAVYQRLLAELDANNQHFSEQISEIDLTDPVDARVLMPEQGGDILAHFGQDHFLERYLRYKAGINEWRQQHPDLVSVDLRYERIAAVLSMPAGTNAAQATSGDNVAENGQNAVEKSEKHASGAKTPKAKAKPAAKGTAKVKAAAARNTNGISIAPTSVNASEKKRAEARRTAQNSNMQKNVPTTRPASSAEQGQ